MTVPAGYTLIDHTGDVGILVQAGSLESLFTEAAAAMFEILVEAGRVEPRETLRIEVDGLDLEDLIVRWLAELLYLHDAKRLVFTGFEILSIGWSRAEGGEARLILRALARGEPLDGSRHRVRTELKAVTHHMTLVSEDSDGWRARVIFDI